VRKQPICSRGRAIEIELGIDFSAFATRPYETSISPLTESEGQRIDQNRLASASFARQRAKSSLKVEFKSVNQHEIANRQTAQHARELNIVTTRRV
jgi:hypothetical protein